MDQDEWPWRMKNTITLATYFNTHRMINDYAEKSWNLIRQDPWKYIPI